MEGIRVHVRVHVHVCALIDQSKYSKLINAHTQIETDNLSKFRTHTYTHRHSRNLPLHSTLQYSKCCCGRWTVPLCILCFAGRLIVIAMGKSQTDQ